MDESPIFFGSASTARLGQIWAAISVFGLVAVEYGVPRSRFERALRGNTRRAIDYAPGRLRDATGQIKEYVEGQRRAFDLLIDWSVLSSEFQRCALSAVLAIPYGETRTYAEIAAEIGHPGAARAVGRANATNPMPLVIPCHRLVGSDGTLRGYGGAGGLSTKAWLLKMEGVGISD
jgi:methylated-DNA-[protein]-cysteine S-methyltransferase